jgi:hypothetical protein
MLTTETTLTLPAGDPLAPDILLDLQAILMAEIRQGEVANVTPQKAPELLAVFNENWRDLHKVITQLTAERNRAEKEVAKRKAVLLLEIVPQRLSQKGIASTADTREAVVTLDEKHCMLQERADQIEAIVEYLKGKLKSFENAFSSVKKIMGEDSYNFASRPNGALKGDTYGVSRPNIMTPTPAQTSSPTTPAGTHRPGFGRSRY